MSRARPSSSAKSRTTATSGLVDAEAALDRAAGASLSLGDALWALRRTDGQSLEAFAVRLDLSRAHLCDIEKGRKAVSPDRAARFARRLGQSELVFVELALQDQLVAARLAYRVKLAPRRGRPAKP